MLVNMFTIKKQKLFNEKVKYLLKILLKGQTVFSGKCFFFFLFEE